MIAVSSHGATGDLRNAAKRPAAGGSSFAALPDAIQSCAGARRSEEARLEKLDEPRGRTLAGKCLCGAVRYAVADAFLYAANCHCSNCRRTTGSAFKPFAGIGRDQLRLVGGAQNLLIFGDQNTHDAHCRTCGSLLYSLVRDGAFVHVAMGTLVDDPTIRPTAHIFVGSKAGWFAIADDLPQYEEHVASGPSGSPGAETPR